MLTGCRRAAQQTAFPALGLGVEVLEEVLIPARLRSARGAEDPSWIRASGGALPTRVGGARGDRVPGLQSTHPGVGQGLRHRTATSRTWAAICYPWPEPEGRAEGNSSLKWLKPHTDGPDFPAKQTVKNSNPGSDL